MKCGGKATIDCHFRLRLAGSGLSCLPWMVMDKHWTEWKIKFCPLLQCYIMMIAVKSYIMSVQWSEFPLTLASALLCGEQCAMLSGEAELTGHWTQLGWGDGAHAEISPAHSLPWLREVQSVGEEQLFQIFCAYLVYKYHADFIGIWEFHDGSWHRDMCRSEIVNI